MKPILFLGAFLAASAMLAADNRPSSPIVPVQMVVTVESGHGKTIPNLNQGDFQVRQGKENLTVLDATPLRGNAASLELFILIDEASRWTLGGNLMDLRQFINTQPDSTAIGIGYMRNGIVDIVQDLVKDHVLAAKSLRLPMAISSSPWLSLSDLIKRWPHSSARREVVMITSGDDPLGGSGVINPYLDSAIENAQRAGVIVYGLYSPGQGHFAHSYWRMTWGQNHLAQLADDTGGEAFMLGFGTPVSLAPYLTSIGEALNHQYRITFSIGAEAKPHLQNVKVSTEVPNADVVAAAKVYVPGDNAAR